MTTEGARLGRLAESLLKTDEDRENALDGYSLFFDVFVRPNPAKYMSFPNYVYKHYASDDRLKTQVVFARRDGRPVAMLWYQALWVLFKRKRYRAAHAADTAAVAEGRGLPFLKMFAMSEKRQIEDGVAFRFGTPNENSMKFVGKFDARLLGLLHSLRGSSSSKTMMQTLRDRASALSPEAACINTYDSCPFDDEDIRAINAVSAENIWPERSQEFYRQRLDDFPFVSGVYVTAQAADGHLLGYLIARDDGLLCDWDVLDGGGVSEEAVLSRLTLALLERVPRLRVPMVNPASRDEALLTACGYWVAADSKGNPYEENFVWRPYWEDLVEEFSDFGRWRTRTIVADWFFNVYQRI